MTFEDIRKKYNIKKIDFILIDTEGYDFEIIKLIDFNKSKPNIIIFEHKHLSASVEDYKYCLSFLKNESYVFRINSGDTMAYQKKISF